MLTRHTDELEADLLERFGVDLRDFYTGGLSVRRLRVLIWRLLRMHGRSALSIAVLGEQASWSNEAYILADIRDSIEAGNLFFLSAHLREGARAPEFTPYPRPGFSADDYRTETNNDPDDWATPQEIQAFFNQFTG